MLNATLDRSPAANLVARIAMAAVGDPEMAKAKTPYEAALALALDRTDDLSIYSSIAHARENARQVRDQITTETWERLNLIYLRMNDPDVTRAFADGSQQFLHDTIADLHLFKGLEEKQFVHCGSSTPDKIASELSVWTTREHRRFAGVDIVFRTGELPANLPAAREKMGAFVADVHKRMTPAVTHVDHFYWVMGLQAWRSLRDAVS
eukprot:gene65145-89124_t